MTLGILTLVIQLPGCASLKDKRSRIKPLIARLHRQFNVSVAEMDRLDNRDEAVLSCALVSNSQAHTQRVLQQVIKWLEANWPDITIMDNTLEII